MAYKPACSPCRWTPTRVFTVLPCEAVLLWRMKRTVIQDTDFQGMHNFFYTFYPMTGWCESLKYNFGNGFNAASLSQIPRLLGYTIRHAFSPFLRPNTSLIIFCREKNWADEFICRTFSKKRMAPPCYQCLIVLKKKGMSLTWFSRAKHR